MLRDYQAGKRPRYQSGKPFQDWHVTSKKLQPKHTGRMLAGEQKYYYTSGRNGFAMFMGDEDAHEPWQTDLAELHQEWWACSAPRTCSSCRARRATTSTSRSTTALHRVG
jgi:hypothetical protein